jgi:hypothetical protein
MDSNRYRKYPINGKLYSKVCFLLREALRLAKSSMEVSTDKKYRIPEPV